MFDLAGQLSHIRVAKPTFLLYRVRELATHLAILKAIGAGSHTLTEISDAALVKNAWRVCINFD